MQCLPGTAEQGVTASIETSYSNKFTARPNLERFHSRTAEQSFQ